MLTCQWKSVLACALPSASFLEGLTWCRVKREVAEALPELLVFFSEAGNAGHGAARAHTNAQVLLQIHQKASLNYAATGEYTWDKVARAIERLHVPLQGQVTDMTAYVAQWSGGVVPVFLQELDDFAKSLPARRDTPRKCSRCWPRFGRRKARTTSRVALWRWSPRPNISPAMVCRV